MKVGHNICECCGREYFSRKGNWNCQRCGYDNNPIPEGRIESHYRSKLNSVHGQIGNISKSMLRTRGYKLTEEEKVELRKELK